MDTMKFKTFIFALLFPLICNAQITPPAGGSITGGTSTNNGVTTVINTNGAPVVTGTPSTATNSLTTNQVTGSGTLALPNGVTLNGFPLTEVFTQGAYSAGISSGTSAAPLQSYKWLNPGTGNTAIYNYTTGAFTNPNLLFIGDSITASGSDRSAGPVQPTYAMITGSTMNVPCVNAGEAGETTTGMTSDYPLFYAGGMPVNTGVPTAVGYWGGANDYLTAPYTTTLGNTEFLISVVYRDQGAFFLQFPTGATNLSGTVAGMSGTTGYGNYAAYITALQTAINTGSYPCSTLYPNYRYNPTFMSGTAVLSGSETASMTTVAGSGTVTINGTTTGGFFVGQSMISANLSGTIQSAPYLGSGSSTTYQIVVSSTASSSATETGSFSTALFDNVHLSTTAQADWAVIYQNAVQTYKNYIIPISVKDAQNAFKAGQTTVSGSNFSTDPDLQVTLQPGGIYNLDFACYVQPGALTENSQLISSGSIICNVNTYLSGVYQGRISNANVTPIKTIYAPTGLTGQNIQVIGQVINSGTAPAVITFQVADSGTGSVTTYNPAHLTAIRIK